MGIHQRPIAERRRAMKANIKNPIARVILITLSYISIAIIFILVIPFIVIMLIPAIPYAMIKGLVNTEYYEDWVNFINKYIFD